MPAPLFIKLDVDYEFNEKIDAAGERAEVLFIRMTCRARALNTDGVITKPMLRNCSLSGIPSRVRALVAVGLWEEIGDGKYRIVGYLERNPSSAEIDQNISDRKVRGAHGNHMKYGKPEKTCSLCFPNGVPNDSQQSRSLRVGQDPTRCPKASPEEEAESEEESEEETELYIANAVGVHERKPVDNFDELVMTIRHVTGIKSTPTKTESQLLAKAAREISDAGGDVSEIEHRSTIYRKRWPDVRLTPMALVKHWSSLADSAITVHMTPMATCVDCNGIGWLDSDHGGVIQCGNCRGAGTVAA